MFRFLPSSFQHGGGTKRARVGWDGDDAAVVDSLHETDLASYVDWPVTASKGATDAGGSSEDSSPPRLCLPTGNVIDDGTFCPDDELFLQARPPVRAVRASKRAVRVGHCMINSTRVLDLQVQNLLRPLYEGADDEAGDSARAGSGSDKHSGGLGLRLDISPLSTMLSGEALERARKSCEDASGKAGAPSTPATTSAPVAPRVVGKAGSSSTRSHGAESSQAPPGSPHGAMLDSLLEKLELGEIPLAGENAGPRAAPVLVRPTAAPAPLGTAGVASRGYLHRQILHSLFVSEGATQLRKPAAGSENREAAGSRAQ